MTKTTPEAGPTPQTTMRAQDLPEVARKAWWELLKVMGEDEDEDIDLVAHFEIFRQAAWVSEDGSEVRTTAGKTWFMDDATPYLPGVA